MTQKERLKWFSRKILGKELDLNDFDEKLTIQKSVYLAKHLGMNFDYNFGWYVRGVYSSSLTVDVYEIHDIESSYPPSDKDIQIANQLLSIKDAVGTIAQTFELVSSVVYAKLERKMNKEEIIKFTKSVKPWFQDSEINKAIDLAQQLPVVQ